MRIRAALLSILLPFSAVAEEPLSVIEWLSKNPPAGDAGPVLLEPPVTENGLLPDILVSPLQVLEPPVGLVPTAVTGLPVDLWQSSDVVQLTRLIAEVPVLDSPAMQTLLYTLLLTEAVPPIGSDSAEMLLLARTDRLMALGAVDPAQAMMFHTGATHNADRYARWFDATLLTGQEERSCQALNAQPFLAPDYAARMFCAVRNGDWSAAAVMLDAARVLELLPQNKLFLMDRFLNPDIFEGAPPLPPPSDPDPLTFRLFESIGEPLPTASLPRRFAVADLRDLGGWKAQIEASERLARTGALSPNALLGIYSARLPAASGGVWDRVEALQRFETALNARDMAAVTKTLPPVWAYMKEMKLEVPFAVLFSEKLAQQPLRDPDAVDLAFRIRLLSPYYEAAADDAPDTSDARFLASVARGAPVGTARPHVKAEAIREGFSDTAKPPVEMTELLENDQLGIVILKAIELFDSGARGNLTNLNEALATFRAVGLEDTARRAALQLMLLDRTGS